MANAPSHLGASLHKLSGAILLLTVVVAPCALGSITPPTQALMQAMLFASAAAWFAGQLLGRERSSIPLLPRVCAIAILVQGWWMTFNAKTAYDPVAGRFVPVPGAIAILPGTADRAVSTTEMLTLTAVLLAARVAADVFRCPRWRRRFFWAVTGTGAALAAFGIAQKWGWFPPVIHVDPRRDSVFFFATFNCHGNAGTFFNLCLPAALALTAVSLRDRRPLAATAAIASSVLIVAATVVNVSKGASAIAAGILLVMIGAALLQWRRRRRPPVDPDGKSGSRAAGAATIVLLAIATIALAPGIVFAASDPTPSLWHRWADVSKATHGRLAMARVAAAMAADAGPFGHGPGTFKILMPHSPYVSNELYSRWIVRTYIPGETVPIWNHAHNDYLQLVVEWGYLGSSAWLIMIASIGLSLVNRLRKNQLHGEEKPQTAWILNFAVALALVGWALHSAIDFPSQIAALRVCVAAYIAAALASHATDTVAVKPCGTHRQTAAHNPPDIFL